MNKRILTTIVAIVAVILLIALALPYYLGVKAQQSLDDQRALLAKSPFLVIDKQSYRRGWFTSTETIQIHFKPSFFAGVQQQLPDNVRTVLQQPVTLVNHVQHGLFAGSIRPVRAHVTTELRFTPQAQQILARFFGQEAPVKLENTINLSGSGQMHVVIPKFNYEELSGIKISWQGLESTIDYAKDFNSYDSHTVSPGLDMILATKGRASYQDLQLNSHTEYGKTSLALGNSNLGIKTITFNWNDTTDNTIRLDQLVNLVTNLQIGAFISPAGNSMPTKIMIQDLKLATSTEEKDQWINSNGKFGFAKLQYGNDIYGPLNIDASAEHLDAASLVAINNKITQLSTQNLNNEQLRAAIVEAVRNEGLGLFTHDPLLKLNTFKLQMPQGLIDIHGNLGFKSLLASDMQQLGLMLNKMDAEMDFAIPQAIMENFAISQARALFTVDASAGGAEALEDIDQTIRLMIDSAIKSMQARGYIQVTNGIVKTHLKLINGKVYLNGKIWNIEPEPENEPDYAELPAASAPEVVNTDK
ncbi:YdgA family protein [Snodgrassella communis]|uniref:YdgA family protein n=1 Tax=Snodgrassella communis TaxID=2946699 RepID=UPI001EF4E31B|nr:YdgA family protein [Snodgrassella communis]WMY91154.1 YdgA family protein [Snodgrassella communis]